jgi:nitrogen regulatory protein PII
MKLITAVLGPDCLEDVREALDRNEARILSAAPVVDDRYTNVTYRGAPLRQPRPRLRVEVVVLNDLAVPDTISTLSRVARERGSGDGLLIVAPVDDVVRLPIVTSELGSADTERGSGPDPGRGLPAPLNRGSSKDR